MLLHELFHARALVDNDLKDSSISSEEMCAQEEVDAAEDAYDEYVLVVQGVDRTWDTCTDAQRIH